MVLLESRYSAMNFSEWLSEVSVLLEGTMFSVCLSFSQSIHSGFSVVQSREFPALKESVGSSLFPVMHDVDMRDSLDGLWSGKGPGRSCFQATHFSNRGSRECALLVRPNLRYMDFTANPRS